MNLPGYIETNEDVMAWEEYLKQIPTDELVGFMLDRMLIDMKFFDLVKSRFVKADSMNSLKGILEAFDNEVNREYQSKHLDSEYVIAITRNFIRAVDELGEEAQKEGYKHMVAVLADGYINYGLAYGDEVMLDSLLVDLGSSLGEIV